jgi:hypothetical protein
MGRPPPDIDRLIDEGLAHYGRGDLDGALRAWEQALELDPHHEQALGYIDYVRMNYELLASEVSGHGEPPAFPISDEPDYQIQAEQGELSAGSAVPRYGAPLDGWAIEEEEPGYGRLTVRHLTFELDPDEPEAELELEPYGVVERVERVESAGISFEDATKEYGGPGRELSPFSDDGGSEEFRIEITPTPEFESSQVTPTPGFEGLQPTDVRPRELGFVQPVAPPAPELERTPRTPGGPAGSTPALPIRPAEERLELGSIFDLPPDVDPPTIERSPINPLTAELIASLPARSEPRAPREAEPPPARDISPPRAVLAAAPPRATSPAPPVPAGARSTIEGLPPVRGSSIPSIPSIPSPARLPTSPPIVVDLSARGEPHEFEAPTERKDRSSSAPALASAVKGAREPRPGTRPSQPSLPADLGPLISAPTRDLGLRPGSTPDIGTPPEEEPTGPAEAGPHRAPVVSSTTTHTDFVLPFDPIDARSAQILDAIDRRSPAPPEESREDCTRRRIAALFEHAIEWSKAGELDRAVTAVDLALSEDPNSALAQKLIHRNRDTIMNVFQTFLGDLHRTPVLARPLHELATSPISPRAAFLLSRVDGLLSLDEILDVSGMPRMEAYRYLCQLFLRGILR